MKKTGIQESVPGQMAIISFISTQLVQTYPQHTHTYTQPNTLSTTAPLLHLSILSSFTFCRKRRLSYEVFSDKRPKRHPNTARERQKDKERGGKGFKGGGAEGESGWPRLSLPVFLTLIWNRSLQRLLSKPQAVRYHPLLRLQRIWFKLDVHHSLWLASLCYERMS